MLVQRERKEHDSFQQDDIQGVKEGDNTEVSQHREKENIFQELIRESQKKCAQNPAGFLADVGNS